MEAFKIDGTVDQALKLALILFIALTSNWRIRSAETP